MNFTLKEAIEKEQGLAGYYNDRSRTVRIADDFDALLRDDYLKQAEEHIQMMQWLSELKTYREKDGKNDSYKDAVLNAIDVIKGVANDLEHGEQNQYHSEEIVHNAEMMANGMNMALKIFDVYMNECDSDSGD